MPMGIVRGCPARPTMHAKRGFHAAPTAPRGVCGARSRSSSCIALSLGLGHGQLLLPRLGARAEDRERGGGAHERRGARQPERRRDAAERALVADAGREREVGDRAQRRARDRRADRRVEEREARLARVVGARAVVAAEVARRDAALA